jgi:RNA polymerase sigma-70 factor (ECF subfamily)
MEAHVAFTLERLDGDDRDRLVARWYGPVRALCLRMTGRDGEAEELAQETFARALRAADTYDAERPLSAWLFTIAANVCRDHLARAERLKPLEPESGDVAIDLPPDSALLRGEDRARAYAAIDRLPFDLKIVVVLHFQHDLEPHEIAEALGLTSNAVRIRLYRALKQLRQEFKE